MATRETPPDVVRGVLTVKIADASGISKTPARELLWDPAFTEGFIKGICAVDGAWMHVWVLTMGDGAQQLTPRLLAHTVEIRGGARTVKV